MEAGLIGFAVLLAMAFAGIHLGVAMFLTGFFGFVILRGLEASASLAGTLIFDASMSYGFALLPLFLLMGNLIYRSKLSEDLYDTANAWMGHRPGGLAKATVAACGGFAAVCGSSIVTTTTMASVAMPSMRRYKYDDRLSTGAIAAGGTLGILIPPSVLLVFYGILTNSDIGKLFIAGIVPGLISIITYFIVIDVMTRIKPEMGPRGERVAMADRIRSLKKVWGVVALFLFVLGGIYIGFVTPVEAGAIGAVGALLFALGRRLLSFQNFQEALLQSVRTSAMLFFVIFGAQLFSAFINVADLPGQALSWIQSLDLSAMGVMAIILLFYIAFGCVFSAFALVLLTVPVFFPLVAGLGLDAAFGTTPENVLIWFGIVIVVVAEIGQITPPIGMNVFVLKSMLPDVELSTIFKGIMPFFGADLVRLALIVLFPATVLALPDYMDQMQDRFDALLESLFLK
ncbi:MAG TPA: TRAP transporter large permease [Rhodospirillales bacterium]|nr:TRAP transporter large permease [Rhodospirillales bacterium]